MSSLKIIFVVFVSLIVIGDAFAAPFLERIYNANTFNGQVHQGNRRANKRHRARTEKPRGRSYKDICRAVNPAPYAFPNMMIYPSVPIC